MRVAVAVADTTQPLVRVAGQEAVEQVVSTHLVAAVCLRQRILVAVAVAVLAELDLVAVLVVLVSSSYDMQLLMQPVLRLLAALSQLLATTPSTRLLRREAW